MRYEESLKVKDFLKTWRKGIQRSEYGMAERVLSCSKEELKDIWMYSNGWILKTLKANNDLKKLKYCKKLILIGSGFFPYSLLQVYKYKPSIKLIGIDRDINCCKISSLILYKLDISCDEIDILYMDGNRYPFYSLEENDLVFVSSDIINAQEIFDLVDENSMATTFQCLPRKKIAHV